MKPHKIGTVTAADGESCDVFVVSDPDGGWTAVRAGDVILVRAAGSAEIELANARLLAKDAQNTAA
jgi:hypothetical protein